MLTIQITESTADAEIDACIRALQAYRSGLTGKKFLEQMVSSRGGNETALDEEIAATLKQHRSGVSVPQPNFFDNQTAVNALVGVPAGAPTSAPMLVPDAVIEASTFAGTAVPGEVDTAGKLWDEAIHSSSRAKNKDGTWRARRNIGAGEVPPPPIAGQMAMPFDVPPPPPVLNVSDMIQRITAAGISPETIVLNCRAVGVSDGILGLVKAPEKFEEFMALATAS
jgi:hypothetical protein